ncbi:hypothetical protein MFRU_012g00280 [Monilinia fructicola]|nr:hypothetical protein MFRU_012g00280 [Monilinia fructicola]
MSFSSSSTSSSQNKVKSKAEVYADMAKELKKDMLSIFICTKCNTKGKIVQVIDHTLPMGELQAGDSWALKMVKMNTRHELHPFVEAPSPSGSETGTELRRLLQISRGENAAIQEKYNSALASIEKMQSNHKIELQQQRDVLSATLKEIKKQIQEQKEELSGILCLEKDRYEILHEKHASLDSMYQDTQVLFKEEQKKNVGLVSDHGKLTKKYEKLHLDHAELRALLKKQKPFVDVGVAIRLRWLENIHSMFPGQSGRVLDGSVVEAGNASAHHANFEADSLLAHHASLSAYSSSRVSESIHRIYGQRYAPTELESPVICAYPRSIIFTLNCKTTVAVRQFRDSEIIVGPHHQRLRLILRDMRALWELSTTHEEFEALPRVQELREEVDLVWRAAQIDFRDRKWRTKPPD